MRLRILYNPAAGRGRARRHVAEVEARLRASGAEVECIGSTTPHHLISLAEESSQGDWDRVVVCGGDGTVNLALRRFHLDKGVFAVVPLGSGDDFAQTAGIPRQTEAACDTILRGTVREMDVATVNGIPYVGVAGFGFDSIVAERANAVRLLRGSLVYLYSIFSVLPRFKPREVRITVDGQLREETIMFAVIGNTHRYGAGIKIVPTAVADDGVLDLCVVHQCSRLDLLKTLPKAYSGRHIESPFVSLERGRCFELGSDLPMRIYADGEYLADTPATITLHPQKLRVVVPNGS